MSADSREVAHSYFQRLINKHDLPYVDELFGPLETEWYQAVPPPKVAPSALARATVRALQQGVEDVFVGDIAEDIRARLAVSPKALERELGS